MELFFIEKTSENNSLLALSPDDSRHLVKVMRKQEGDPVHCTDGQGTLYHTIIAKADHRKCLLSVVSVETKEPPSYPYIHIAIAPTKNLDRIEFFLEKSIEIGVQEITFLLTGHSERKVIKLDRMHRIAVAALKQSQQFFLPQMNEMTNLPSFLPNASAEQKFMAYVPEKPTSHLFQLAKPKNSYCLLIGPEGGFSEEEAKLATEHGFQTVSLGENRLRTETAGLVGCHILNLVQLNS